jgi:hypothetical protein
MAGIEMFELKLSNVWREVVFHLQGYNFQGEGGGRIKLNYTINENQ